MQFTLAAARGRSLEDTSGSAAEGDKGAGKVAVATSRLTVLSRTLPSLLATETVWFLLETLLELLRLRALFIVKSHVSECTFTGLFRFIKTRTKP